MKTMTLILSAIVATACSYRQGNLSTPMSTVATAPAIKFVPGESYDVVLTELLSKPLAPGASVDFLQFNFFTESGHARALGEKLKALKAQNPASRVRVVLEGEKDADMALGAATRNKLTQAFFAGSGVDVRLISGLRQGAIKGVTHAKAVRVGDVVLSGSTNLTNTSLDKNNEFNVLVQSEKIAQALTAFVDDLVEDSTRLHAVLANDGAATMMTDDLFFDQALALIKGAGAGDSLDLTTYFFAYRTDADAKAKRIFDEVVAAQGRGAKVRIYLERNANHDVNQDITRANLQIAERLDAAGVGRVYLDPQDKISHAKIIKISGPHRNAALIGSTNIFRGDFDENHQVNFLIEQEDLVAALTAYLNQKFAYEGTKQSVLGGATVPPMMRFWRGYKQSTVDSATFAAKLNSILIPELGIVGVGRGLQAYLPALLPKAKPAFLPDEVALISYASEESYEAIRSTPRGAGYGPLHFAPGLFAKETADGLKSGSTLTEPWTGSVAIGKAYAVGQNEVNWQLGKVELRTVLRPTGVADGDFLQTVATRLTALASQNEGVDAAIVLVDQAYTMELVHYESAAAPAVSASDLTAFNVIAMAPQKQESIAISFDSGASMQFPTALLPASQLIGPVNAAFH